VDVTRIDGYVFLFFFIVFLYYSFGAAKTIEDVKDLPLKSSMDGQIIFVRNIMRELNMYLFSPDTYKLKF
jgi:Ca2+/Na+ antiporter